MAKLRTQPTVKFKAENPKVIKSALKGWVKANDKLDPDPFGWDEAPPWVEKALFETMKVIMPGGQWPSEGEIPLELLGEVFGRLQAVGKLYTGEIPMGPETQVMWSALEKQAATRLKSPKAKTQAKKFAKDFSSRIAANTQLIPLLTEASIKSSHEDSIKFQRGLLRGMTLEPDELMAGRIFQRHTLTFWVLGICWRYFAQCRSVAEVHRKLCDMIGEKKVGPLKTFENRVAKKIGMKFRRSGRPSKVK